MENERYTPEGLLVVKQETIDSYLSENSSRNRRGEDLTNVTLKEIVEKENPDLLLYIIANTQGFLSRSPVSAYAYLEGATQIYDLLRRQRKGLKKASSNQEVKCLIK